MRDQQREDLNNRLDLAKVLCVHKLKELLRHTDDPEARRALEMYRMHREVLNHYDLAMANPQQPEPVICGGMVRP